jgi:hypothetical protein
MPVYPPRRRTRSLRHQRKAAIASAIRREKAALARAGCWTPRTKPTLAASARKPSTRS